MGQRTYLLCTFPGRSYLVSYMRALSYMGMHARDLLLHTCSASWRSSTHTRAFCALSSSTTSTMRRFFELSSSVNCGAHAWSSKQMMIVVTVCRAVKSLYACGMGGRGGMTSGISRGASQGGHHMVRGHHMVSHLHHVFWSSAVA